MIGLYFPCNRLKKSVWHSVLPIDRCIYTYIYKNHNPQGCKSPNRNESRPVVV